MPDVGAPAGALDLALGRPTGTNGEKLHLTVTAKQAGTMPHAQVRAALGAEAGRSGQGSSNGLMG